MPREVAPCGTPTAYRRHLRKGETPCLACKKAESDRQAANRAEEDRLKAAERDKKASHAIQVFEDLLGGPLAGQIDMRAELEANLLLIKQSMALVAASEPAKLAPLSKRHSELLAELASLDDDGEKEDPLESFLSSDSGGASANVTRFPSATDRASA